MRGVAIALAAVALTACGDNGSSRCYVEIYSDVFGGSTNRTTAECDAALRFVARDSPTVTPSQDSVDRYFERWSRVVAAEPILAGRGPQRYRTRTNELVAEITTRNPAVISAFASGPVGIDIPPTGDTKFDQLMSELVRPQLLQNAQEHDGSFRFAIASSAELNEELLHTRLLEVSSSLPDPYQAYQDDGIWTWQGLGPGPGDDDATAQIDFSFGWGDCFVSCEGMHDLRAIVPPSGPATVYDMGGDPLPPNLVLSPTTLPPP